MKSGKTTGLSGKEMFMFNPSIISQATEDDDDEGGDFDLNIREKDDDYAGKVNDFDKIVGLSSVPSPCKLHSFSNKRSIFMCLNSYKSILEGTGGGGLGPLTEI